MAGKAVVDFKPIQSRAANLQVYDQVRQAISSGRFMPGDGLSTRQFAEALDVSQIPVREAFHRLVAEGALENRPNRTIGLPQIGRRVFSELTEIRLSLEGMATEKANENLTGKELAKLRKLLTEMEVAAETDNHIRYLEANRQFHFLIYQASGSQTLVTMIDQLWLRVGPVLNWSAKRRDSVLDSKTSHSDAVAALESGDAAGARTAIERDLKDAAEIVKQQLDHD